jgi:hypothetical protein
MIIIVFERCIGRDLAEVSPPPVLLKKGAFMLSQQHRKRVRFYNLLLTASVCAILLLFQQGGHAHAATNDGLSTPVSVGTCSQEVPMETFSDSADEDNTTFHLDENVYAWYDNMGKYCGKMTAQAIGVTDGNGVYASVTAWLEKWSANGQLNGKVESKSVEFIPVSDPLPATTEISAYTDCGVVTADFNASPFSLGIGGGGQYTGFCPPPSI